MNIFWEFLHFSVSLNEKDKMKNENKLSLIGHLVKYKNANTRTCILWIFYVLYIKLKSQRT